MPVTALPAHQSFKSALVLIPPAASWTSIERVRRVHDKRFERWMPHITLVFPFVETIKLPATERATILNTVESIVGGLPDFEISLQTFGFFKHSARSHTLFLRPDHVACGKLNTLVARLAEALPQYDDVRRDGILTPHLSLGNFQTERALEAAKAEYADLLQEQQPFQARCITWVTRAGYKDRMTPQREFHFGSGSNHPLDSQQ